MNHTEHLLACQAEEGGEVVQVAMKAVRFGLDHVWPEKNESNRIGASWSARLLT